MFFGAKSKRNARIDSLIGNNTDIKGDIRFNGGLHIDGVVKGNVVAESDDSVLTLSEHGRIEGEVRVGHVVLNGEVKGDVYAARHIELAPRARVAGDVYYHLIEMAMGAEVNGKLVHRAHSVTATPVRGDEPAVRASVS
jgi:cytoskeletal protein CcmA (bactofilin family)